MRGPEATLARRVAAPRALIGTASVTGWGLGPPASVRVFRPSRVDDVPGALMLCRELGETTRGAIARGMGRSYGDAAQLDRGLVLETTRLKRFELELERGVATAEAGVTLAELLEEAVPKGWMVPVVPGTQ